MIRKTSGNNPVASNAEIGYVCLPSAEMESRDKYIQRCIRNYIVNVVSLRGIVYNNCKISSFKNVKFPNEVGETGTMVLVLFPYSKTNSGVVAQVYPEPESYPSYENEFQEKEMIETDNCVISLIKDAVSGIETLSIYGKVAGKSNLNICLGSVSKDANFNIDVQGDVKVNSTKTLELNVQDELKIKVKDVAKQTTFSTINYKLGQGFTLTDEFQNEIITKSTGIHVNAGNVKIGKTETLEAIFLELFDLIEAMTLKTPSGFSFPVPNNWNDFIVLKNRITEFMKVD